jgi:hypothetical protein
MKELTLGEMESTPLVTQHRSRIGDFPAADGDVSRAVCCAGAVESIDVACLSRTNGQAPLNQLGNAAEHHQFGKGVQTGKV